MKVDVMNKKPESAVWAHVDINSYFATLLQQENPALRGKPVGIVKEHRRSCIIAASKEAKALGVGTGSRAQDVRHVSDLILVPAQFDFYLDATKRLKRLFESLAPTVQIFSLDEAFIQLTDCQRLYPDPIVFGTLVQDKIKAELGEWVTANVGLSWNRFLAKMAGETGPKGSVTKITPDNLDEKLSTTAFRDVCGVGYRLEKRLAALGIENLYQIHLVTDAELQDHFGPYWSQQLRRMSRGEEPDIFDRIDRNPLMKSVGRSITGYRPCDSEMEIKRTLYNLVIEVTSKARKMGLAGRHISVYLMGDHQYWYDHVTLKRYTNQTQEMFDLVYSHLYGSWTRHFQVMKFAVRLSMLQPVSSVERPLWPQWQRRQQLEQAVDQVTAKYGLFTVRPATLLRGRLIRPEVTGWLGDKTYQFRE